MATLNNIKNSLIDRIRATENKKLLQTIDNILKSNKTDDVMSLSSEQNEMLRMSERDIENGKMVSESDLEQSDTEWLN